VIHPIETPRLLLRPLNEGDLSALAAVLSDPETMRWYPRPYSGDEVQKWIERQTARYLEDSGLLGVVEKQTGRLIGDCGTTWQEVEGRMELGIGYHFHRERWNQGFATEAARAVMEEVFRTLSLQRLISLIRPENVPSRRVAEKNGLTVDRIIFWRDYEHCVYQRVRDR
jgi:RimJ/RimL family protein N-acetyltransferase